MSDADEDEVYYCPHGEEVPSPGGACYRCADEDADDSGFLASSWGFVPGYD